MLKIEQNFTRNKFPTPDPFSTSSETTNVTTFFGGL